MTLLDQETFDKYGWWPKDLTKGSQKKVCVECDYCGDVVDKKNADFHRPSPAPKDACSKCRRKKSLDAQNINNQRYVGERFGRYIVLEVEFLAVLSGGTVAMAKCRCDCGTIKKARLSRLVTGRTTSCGCRQIETTKANQLKAVEKTRLTVEYGKYYKGFLAVRRDDGGQKKNKSIFICPVCQKECSILNSEVLRTKRPRRSCGCAAFYNIEYNKYYGDVLAIRKGGKNKFGSYMSICICPLCKQEFITSNCKLLSKKRSVKSCGNCGLMRNGVRTSQPALDLEQIIQTRYDTQHNYNTDVRIVRRISVDIAIPRYLIAIEYDSYYHHMVRWGDKSEHDSIRREKLIEADWKVFTIYANGQVPTESEIFSKIDQLINTDETELSITMPDWTIAENKQLVKH